MKHFYLLILILLRATCFGQNVVTTITFNPSENAVTTSLPFDRPIILKWISKEPIVISYAGLVTINKGNVSDYYRNWAQDRSFLELDEDRTLEKNASKITVKRLVTNYSLNPEGKYEVNIFIPPLKPNRFYDLKILRRPLELETNLYFDLFSSIDNAPVFEKKLKYINNLKAPFKHVYFSGPNAGNLMIPELQEFYNAFLKTYYDEIKATPLDNNKVAAATTKIKAAIVNDDPPNAYNITEDYIAFFNAGDNATRTLAINTIASKLKGYIKSDADHVGNFDVAGLKSIYDGDSKLQGLVRSYNASSPGQGREELQVEIMNMILDFNLPLAEDMFVFGQTFSSTSAVLNFDTRTNFTITPDFGFIYYGIGQPGFQGLLPYAGFQLEFRYFDKNIPFRLIHPKSLWHHLSFSAGLTLAPLKKEGKRDDFFTSKSLVLGLGYRLTSATRFTFGGLFFRKEDTNPLKDNKITAITPFIGLSIDLKLKSILNDFYGIISTKKP